LIVLVIRAWKNRPAPAIADGLRPVAAPNWNNSATRPARRLIYDLDSSLPDARVASLYYVFYLPGRLFLGPEKTRAGYLRERKDAVYENLRDLNFEYKAGKVPDVDYASLKSSLQDEAATILAEIDRLEKIPRRKKEKILKSSIVILSEVIASRSEAVTQSKDPIMNVILSEAILAERRICGSPRAVTRLLRRNKREATFLVGLVLSSPPSPPPKLSPAR
jgi:hypothetical protein